MPYIDIDVHLRAGEHDIQVGDQLEFVVTGNSPYGSQCLCLEGGYIGARGFAPNHFTRVLGTVSRAGFHLLCERIPVHGAAAVPRGGPRVGSRRVPFVTDISVSPNSQLYQGYIGPGRVVTARVFY